MASTDSFGAKGTIQAGGAEHEIFRLSAVEGAERLPVQPQGAAGEPAAHRGRCERHRRPHPRARRLGPDRRAGHRDPVHPGPGDHAGLHRRALRRRPRHHARGRHRARRRPGEGQPARPRRAGHRPLGDHRRVRHGRTPSSATSTSSTSRNKERYQFLRWGQGAFDEFKVVPPGTGIVHQVNIEHLARVVMTRNGQAYPDTLVGTDSHTTMVNGLGVLGWGVGGIEAEAAMLGQPVSMLIPQGRRVQADRRDPAGRDRHRRRADDHRDAAPARRGRQVRRVLRRGRRRGAAGQPGHHRQHEPRVRLHRRDLPDRRRDHPLPASSPAARPSSSRSSRPTPRSRASGTTRPASRCTPSTSSWTCPRSSRRSPGRSARRTASSSPTPSRRSASPS